MAKSKKTVASVAVVPLPPVEIIDVSDPADMLNVEPRNARFALDPVPLDGIGIDGKPTKWHWRTPMRTTDLIHVHRGEDGKLYATDGNRRVKTLQALKKEHPGEYAKMLAEYEQRMTAGVSPLWRGYRLNADEAFHRDVMFSLKNDPYIDCALFRSAYNRTPVERFARMFEQLETFGLVMIDKDRINLTPKGRLCVEEITCLFRHPSINSLDSSSSVMKLLQKHNFAPNYPSVAW